MKTSIIGLLFIIALATVLYLGITLSGSGSLGEIFGEAKNEIRVEFDQVTGLKKRDEVTVSGITVGRVSNLELQSSGRVMVTCQIDPKAN
ncbi:MAG: MCE family protein, partial [Planctomycetes bacterium]|nr:MCE family protein [Planctomycetota bacterium]